MGYNVYIVGPVSGHEDLNRLEFERARNLIAENLNGCHVVIPHDLCGPSESYERCMKASLGYILASTDLIVALDGWRESDGARLEIEVASACGIECAEIVTIGDADAERG